MGQPAGWGIAIGTDTAFTLGVLALVGGRWAPRIRTFLLTLVIVDDVAALTVVALAYTEDVSVSALLVASRCSVWCSSCGEPVSGTESPYFLVAFGLWVAMVASGVHATIAGIALGCWARLTRRTSAISNAPVRSGASSTKSRHRSPRDRPAEELTRDLAERTDPASLRPVDSYVIVPLFALANAGMALNGDVLRHGLVAGDTRHYRRPGRRQARRDHAATWLVHSPPTRRLAVTLPWPPLVGAATVAGIGFTVALLIADISFDGDDLDDAKLGILAASVLASCLAWIVFRVIDHLPRRLAFAGGARRCAAADGPGRGRRPCVTTSAARTTGRSPSWNTATSSARTAGRPNQ